VSQFEFILVSCLTGKAKNLPLWNEKGKTTNRHRIFMDRSFFERNVSIGGIIIWLEVCTSSIDAIASFNFTFYCCNIYY